MRYRHTPTLILAALVCVIVVALWYADSSSSAPPSKHQIRSVICSVFTGSKCGPAIRVATCESLLNPFALGRAGERGIFQVHPVHFGWLDERRLFEPRYNARIAFRLSRGGTNWQPWTCSP